MQPMTEAQMRQDLRITFPSLWHKPLREFGADHQQEGVWTGGSGGERMPDGLPIFCSMANGEPPYDGTVHEGFSAWLQRRGWWADRYDGETYFLLPWVEDCASIDNATPWANLSQAERLSP